MIRRAWIVVLLPAAAPCGAGVVFASGGTTIASAPDLPWEQRQSGGGRPAGTSEFFLLPMEAGDIAHVESPGAARTSSAPSTPATAATARR